MACLASTGCQESRENVVSDTLDVQVAKEHQEKKVKRENKEIKVHLALMAYVAHLACKENQAEKDEEEDLVLMD
jgi:hypothetical protein